MIPSVRRVVVAAALVIVPGIASAQGNPGVAAAQKQFDLIAGNLMKTAQVVPENLYAFKATPAVRSIAELIGHVADSNFAICSAASSTPAPAGPKGGFEKTATSKAVLSKALGDSIAYCNTVMASLTDANSGEMTKFFGGMPKIAVVYFNIAHCNEHYGNLVTYMRLNKIVPPSSAGGM
jgi:uncharacterized damage-inducible protein DinB